MKEYFRRKITISFLNMLPLVLSNSSHRQAWLPCLCLAWYPVSCVLRRSTLRQRLSSTFVIYRRLNSCRWSSSTGRVSIFQFHLKRGCHHQERQWRIVTVTIFLTSSLFCRLHALFPSHHVSVKEVPISFVGWRTICGNWWRKTACLTWHSCTFVLIHRLILTR